MTHDNHPTAAPLSCEQIENYRNAWASGVRKNVCNDLCDMALRSLARPVPADMAEDVKIVRTGLERLYNKDSRWEMENRPLDALDRIVAHLSPRDAAPSEEILEWLNTGILRGQRLDSESGNQYGARFWNGCLERLGSIQQALDQARAEGLEMAAQLAEAKGNCRYIDHVQALCGCQSKAEAIRALIPAGQQTKGDGK